jgi:hypothetical protein
MIDALVALAATLGPVLALTLPAVVWRLRTA